MYMKSHLGSYFYQFVEKIKVTFVHDVQCLNTHQKMKEEVKGASGSSTRSDTPFKYVTEPTGVWVEWGHWPRLLFRLRYRHLFKTLPRWQTWQIFSRGGCSTSTKFSPPFFLGEILTCKLPVAPTSASISTSYEPMCGFTCDATDSRLNPVGMALLKSRFPFQKQTAQFQFTLKCNRGLSLRLPLRHAPPPSTRASIWWRTSSSEYSYRDLLMYEYLMRPLCVQWWLRLRAGCTHGR